MDRKNVMTQLSVAVSGTELLRRSSLFLTAAVFACARLPGGAGGLGVAFVCAAVGRMETLLAVLGGVLGGVLGADTVYGLTTVGALLLRTLLGVLLSGKGQLKRKLDERLFAFVRRRVLACGFSESVYARMMLASALTLTGGGILLWMSDYSISLLASVTASGVIAPAAVYLYEVGLDRREASEPAAVFASGIAFALSATLGSRWVLPFADLSLPVAYAVTLAVTKTGGAMKGALYGVVLSLAAAPAGSPVLALCALAAAPVMRLAPAAAALCALGAGCAWSLYFTGLSAMSTQVPSLILTTAVAAPVLASDILPPSSADAKRAHLRSDENMTLVVRDSEMRRRMHSLSEGLSELSSVLYRISDELCTPDTDELCEICSTSFEEYCAKCGMKSACFGRESEKTGRMQSKMVLAMKNEGRVSAAPVPREMASRCFNMGQIIDLMNSRCAALISEAKLYDRTAVVAADYEVTSRLLEESCELGAEGTRCDAELTEKLRRGLLRTSFRADRVAVFGGRRLRAVARGVDIRSSTAGADDIRRAASAACGVPMSSPEFSVDGSCVTMTLTALPALSVRCGRASVAKSAIDGKSSEDVMGQTRVFSADRRGLGKSSSADCGDVINAFLTDDARFFMLISDGMGSGREAAVTSGICAVFIEKLLRAGSTMDTALKMLNSMMRARGNECSATVDLMELDLMNGSARFVKSGAAPSFVIREGRLFRLQSKTVPIGIMRALDAEMISFEALGGDVIVMLSDGVARSFEDCPWLYDLLSSDAMRDDDPERMARTIVRHALENGASDDVTAGVVLLDGSVRRKRR